MDLIDRQAAIDACLKGKTNGLPATNVACDCCAERIRVLPSADAVEVVRCKDCKHSTEWYRDKRRCFLWNENGISVFEDGFCNYGERKDDEQNDG